MKQTLNHWLVVVMGLFCLMSAPHGVDAQTNILNNAGFEEPYGNGVAGGWFPWHEELNGDGDCGSETILHKPHWSAEIAGGNGGELLLEGQRSQHVGNQFATWHGGVAQSVSVTNGSTYTFSTYAWARASQEQYPATSDAGVNLAIRVGIDPTGGGVWSSPNIIWSNSINPHGNWQQISIQATALNDTITVYTASNSGGADNCRAHLDVWFDNASLEASGPPPTSTPLPVPPTNTPQPIPATNTPQPIIYPTNTPLPIVYPTNTPRPIIYPTNTIAPTSTPWPTRTPWPTHTSTPIPTNTPTSTTTPTPTPIPTATLTPTPVTPSPTPLPTGPWFTKTPTPTPWPTKTSTPRPANTAVVTPLAPVVVSTVSTSAATQPTETPTNTPESATPTITATVDAATAEATTITVAEVATAIPATVAPTSAPDDDAQGGTICVNTFSDQNSNGLRDTDEGYMAGISIVIGQNGAVIGQGSSTGTKDAVCFYELEPGAYEVAQRLPASLEMTTASNLEIAVETTQTIGLEFGSRIANVSPPTQEELANATGADGLVSAETEPTLSATNPPASLEPGSSGLTTTTIVGIGIMALAVVLLGGILIALLRKG